ncbi:MAG: hypothetical protein PHS09_04925, partial [Candidatus Omnitrophica bacterium]|nr:hypothetical protein [Candidatus Omnitrophota bacterium]
TFAALDPATLAPGGIGSYLQQNNNLFADNLTTNSHLFDNPALKEPDFLKSAYDRDWKKFFGNLASAMQFAGEASGSEFLTSAGVALAAVNNVSLSNDDAAAKIARGEELSYWETPWFSSPLGLSNFNLGGNYGWTLTGYLTNDVLHPWANPEKIAALNNKLLSFDSYYEYLVGQETNMQPVLEYTAWKQAQLSNPKIMEQYRAAGAISIFDGASERMIDASVKDNAPARYYFKNVGIDSMAALETAYSGASFAGMTAWDNPTVNVNSWLDHFKQGNAINYINPLNQPFKVADFKPFDWKIDQKNNIAELAGMGSNITGNIRGWQMQLENTNLAYVPFDTFYSASGKVQTNFLGNNLTADIFDAGVRYGYGADGKLTGETSLALIGRGAAFDALPGMYSSQVDPNAPQPLSQKFTSFSHYTLDLTKDMRVGSLGGNNLEWVLPGQDVIAKELAQKGAIVAGISSNNFGVGAEAIFGNSITKDSPLHMYGIDFAKDKMLDDKSFWGAGVRFGASEITPLAFDKKTYFNERQVLNSSPFGAVSLGQFTGGLLAEDLAVGKIPGWSYSGTRAQGWQFDQSLTPAHQALSIQGLYGTTNILTDAYTENYTALFANKGQEILYTSGIAAKGGLSNTAEDFGGSFLTRELNRGVYVSKVLEDASHFANINIPQTLATPQQLMSPNNNLWAYDTMFSNAHHTYTGEIKDFVARVGINEQGKVFEEFIAAAAKDRGRLADLTAPVFLNERGFADTLGAVSRYQGVDGSKVLLDVKSVNDIPALARLHEVSFERGGMPFADALNPLKGFDDVSFDGGRNWQKVSAWIDSGKLLFSNDQSMPRLPVYIATAANSHVALERDLSGPQSAENPGLTAKDLTALAARPYNVHADGNTAKGQHIELLLNSNFSGGMQLDQRAMNYHSAGKLNDFATITDGERTPSVLGRMSMIDGNQVVYFDPSGASMISGTGKFLVSSTNPNGLYLDHVYETNGARTHGGIRYDDLTFEYKFKGEGDTARQYVFAHDVTQHGNNFEYSIHHPAVGIMDGKTTYDKLSALKTGEFAGSLHLKNVAEMAFIAPQLRAESDVAEAYKNSVAQRTAQVDAVREQLRKEMGDAALTA